MSPLWRERLLISFAPGEITWLRMKGVLKSVVVGKGTVNVEPGYGAHIWDGAIAALRAEFVKWAREHLTVSVVLSNQLVRYALVPPSAAVSGRDEELALARFQFHKVHGDASRGWAIRLSPGRSDRARLACATDTLLLDALRQTFPVTQRPRLTSVQPLLMSAFNHGSDQIPADGAWLILAEPDRACIALIQDKTWHAVQNVKGQFPNVESWLALVERERWRVSLDNVPTTVLVHDTQASTIPPRLYGTWKVSGLHTRWAHGLQPSRDGAYIRALSAI